MWHFGEPSLEDLLSEPIVRLLMSADGVDEEAVRRVASAAPVEHGNQLIRTSGCPGIRFYPAKSEERPFRPVHFAEAKPGCLAQFLGAATDCPEGA